MEDFIWIIVSPVRWKRVVSVEEIFGVILRATTYDGAQYENLRARSCAGARLLEMR